MTPAEQAAFYVVTRCEHVAAHPEADETACACHACIAQAIEQAVTEARFEAYRRATEACEFQKEQARREEREACAMVAEQMIVEVGLPWRESRVHATNIAAAIRARAQESEG